MNWSRGDGARECITTPALAKAVEARLGRSVFVSPAAAQFMLEARIEGGPSQWSATISLQDGHRVGQRDLSSTERDCRALDQSLSLMLALAIDPNATLAIEALVGEGRLVEAQGRASQFRASFPQSAYLRRIDAVLRNPKGRSSN